MCKLKSGILFKDSVFLPNYDSHDKMLEELGIEDTYINAARTFVRFELCPCGSVLCRNNVDVKNWSYFTDQDILPDWYDAKDAEIRVRESVENWARAHIFVKEKVKMLSSGVYYLIDCDVDTVCGDAEVLLYGCSTVQSLRDHSVVSSMHDYSKVSWMIDRSRVVNMYDYCEVERMCDDSSIECIHGHATVKCMSGKSRIFDLEESGYVHKMRGDSIIYDVFDDAFVETIEDYGSIIRSKSRFLDKSLLRSADSKS